ncbi:MAG TPA: bifunctional (p)ppGpp synthetase/guanosine-3',5'-bis(diphosphate) 3'-pyrophosphohydrolase [Candidatus Acidoferrum sp.]|nr:bifunctional (p)ppGpp synthetase/guanosine-3',5'-bis(diphosphate) 3'-pyrophosphohydrolase [Candidatus Acidoferrum sp.]
MEEQNSVPRSGAESEPAVPITEDALGRLLVADLEASGHPYDMELINKAFCTAREAHKGQMRRSGEEYISHPVEVARILAGLGMDTECVVSALLHDVVEDTKVTEKEVKRDFGPDIAALVAGVTKLGKIPYTSKEEEQVENLRKMFLATAKDIRVIIIKLADRLHNMRTLAAMPDYKRREKSRETMEVYAPLAHRLGMQRMKVELEDLSLRYLDPIGYAEISREFEARASERESFLEGVMKKLEERIGPEFPGCKIEGRVKHIYSVYNKMYKQNKTLSEIYDLYALRVIVNTVEECYNVLGVIHDMWRSIPGKLKDYISTPKPNMYQSIHTTVIGTEGMPFEVQIRTWDMHRTAELGIAAHWKYKRGMSKKDSLDGKLEWVRKILEIQSTAADPEDFMSTFKIDFFDDEVFVFTPRGDLINLPIGATAIDFAYAIHSEVGNRTIGAKVNGKMVTLDYKVQNGDIVEVMTTKEAGKGPSRDWLSIATTTEAKNKIKQWFKREKRDENIQRGRAELEQGLKQALIALPEDELEEMLGPISRRLGVTGPDELYAAIGYGGLTSLRVLSKVKEEYGKTHKPSDQSVLEKLPEAAKLPTGKSQSGISIEGMDDCLIKFARCCNPLPGDDVVGYITKGFGVSVHRRDCKNFLSGVEKGIETERWIPVQWTGKAKSSYQTELKISCIGRTGLLADLTMALANMKVSIHAMNAREDSSGGISVISVVIDVNDVGHLNQIIARLMKIKGVTEIRRGKVS